eukprot:8867386-Lingulodinium_polyedra.AAC.1
MPSGNRSLWKQLSTSAWAVCSSRPGGTSSLESVSPVHSATDGADLVLWFSGRASTIIRRE